MNFRITNGSISFGAETILEEINFEVKGKEKVAIVGRNGAGKSTIIKCIMGFFNFHRSDPLERAGKGKRDPDPSSGGRGIPVHRLSGRHRHIRGLLPRRHSDRFGVLFPSPEKMVELCSAVSVSLVHQLGNARRLFL